MRNCAIIIEINIIVNIRPDAVLIGKIDSLIDYSSFSAGLTFALYERIRR